MSDPQPAKPAKLIVGLFMANKELLPAVCAEMEELFGPIDIVSRWFRFDYTDYYSAEMGAPLFRRVIVFKPLIRQRELAAIKVRTNEAEHRFSDRDQRTVNIDPGYMLQERFVLATGKNYSHRIYIGQGIYADLTLIYRKGTFRKLDWTYPDYAATPMIAFLNRVRRKYILDLNQDTAS